MSIFKKNSQSSGPYTVSSYNLNTTAVAAPSNIIYSPSISGCGTQGYKSYINPNSYVKAKLKDGNEVEVTLKDYINYPVRMGKELEDSTLEEFNEWKMVNEL